MKSAAGKLIAFPKAKRIRRAVRDRRIESGMYLVRVAALSLARKLPLSFEIDDLISEGYLGLIAAAESWDPARGSFLTRARFLINAAMIDSVRRRNWTANTMEPFEKPTRGNGLADADRGHHAPRSTERGYQLIEADPVGAFGAPEDALIDAIDEKRKRAILTHEIGGLTPRLQIVMRTHYTQDAQIATAAKTLGVDASRASQMHHEALRVIAGGFTRRGLPCEYADLRAAVVAVKKAA